MCESLLLYGLQDCSMGHEQVLFAPPGLIGFFFFLVCLFVCLNQCIIHGPLHFNSQHCISFIFHGNLTPHCCLAPLAIILLCWAFSNIVCVGFMGLLYAIYRPHFNSKRNSYVLAPFTKGFQVHTSRSCSNYERNLNNLATFTPHNHGL